MTDKNDAWILLAKKIDGEATEKELQTFQELLPQHPTLEQALHIFSYIRMKPAGPQNKEDIENLFARILQRIEMT